MNETDTLFVYGTLQRGRPAHILMRLRDAEYLGDAQLDGYALYDLTFYPGIVPSEHGTVLGEAYRVNGAAIKTLDLYECEGTLFSRHAADISIKGIGIKKAYVYVYNKSVDAREMIPLCRQPWRIE